MRLPSMGAPMEPTSQMAWSRQGLHPPGSGVDQPRTMSTRANAISSRLTEHTDQTAQAAARRLIPPIPRSCSLARSVTTTTLQHHRLPNVTTNVTSHQLLDRFCPRLGDVQVM